MTISLNLSTNLKLGAGNACAGHPRLRILSWLFDTISPLVLTLNLGTVLPIGSLKKEIVQTGKMELVTLELDRKGLRDDFYGELSLLNLSPRRILELSLQLVLRIIM